MLHMLWLWLQGVSSLGGTGLDNESSSDSGHGVDPNG